MTERSRPRAPTAPQPRPKTLESDRAPAPLCVSKTHRGEGAHTGTEEETAPHPDAPPLSAGDDLARAVALARRELSATDGTYDVALDELRRWNEAVYAAAEHDPDYVEARDRIRSRRTDDEIDQ